MHAHSKVINKVTRWLQRGRPADMQSTSHLAHLVGKGVVHSGGLRWQSQGYKHCCTWSSLREDFTGSLAPGRPTLPALSLLPSVQSSSQTVSCCVGITKEPSPWGSLLSGMQSSAHCKDFSVLRGAIAPYRSSASCVGPSHRIGPLPGFRIILSFLVLWSQGSTCEQPWLGTWRIKQVQEIFWQIQEEQWNFKKICIYLTCWVLVAALGIFSLCCGTQFPDQGLNPGRLRWECGLPAPNHQGSLPAEFLCLSHLCLPNLSSNIKSVPRTHVYTELRE